VLTAELAFWVSPKSTLVYGSRPVITAFLVLPQLSSGKQVMLVSEDLFVFCTEIAHELLMCLADMMVQVRPAQACDIASRVWAVVPQYEQGVFADSSVGKPNTERCIRDCNIKVCKLSILLLGPREDHKVGAGLYIS
jgi:hypothetical protein